MTLEVLLDFYRDTFLSLNTCFDRREQEIVRYLEGIDDEDIEAVVASAQTLEVIHQVQHSFFGIIGILSRHLLFTIDLENARQVFEVLYGEPLEPEGQIEMMLSIVEKAERSSENAREWIHEELLRMRTEEYDDEQLVAVIIGCSMLILSENYHHIVNRHSDLTERMITAIKLAGDRFDAEEVNPSHYISRINPAEGEKMVEELITEYTKKFIDPDTHMAYQ